MCSSNMKFSASVRGSNDCNLVGVGRHIRKVKKDLGVVDFPGGNAIVRVHVPGAGVGGGDTDTR